MIMMFGADPTPLCRSQNFVRPNIMNPVWHDVWDHAREMGTTGRWRIPRWNEGREESLRIRCEKKI